MQHYKVLARAYRPQTFDALIGQDALVQVLTNAISANRIPHAIMMSGPRGVGKTTTARLIARALNCAQGPTMTPCGTCEHCEKIACDSHIDVIEMDAASRTGVDDVRDLIEGVRYKPVLARYKIYIIDEVHMLSKHAFNAFLKTLEEPPAGVVFIFATTEIRKVPVTVLSRCMRFDLKLVPIDILMCHLIHVASQEKIALDEKCAQILASASGGSVRDALSLLDQAIVFCESQITAEAVIAMLGLADRKALYELAGSLLQGQIKESLAQIQHFCALGLDPKFLLQDLLNITYVLSRGMADPDSFKDLSLTEIDRIEGQKLLASTTMSRLGSMWQMLMKGLDELKIADNPYQAVEMIAIRIAYLSQMPSPIEIVQGAALPEAVPLVAAAPHITMPTLQSPVERQMEKPIERPTVTPTVTPTATPAAPVSPLVRMTLDAFPDAKVV